MKFSEYQSMWNVVMFDLPVGSTKQRRDYNRFRNLLLQLGFSKLQFSVYARFFGSEKQSEPASAQLIDAIPQDGHVRILKITDRQFSRMQNFFGEIPIENEKADEQILLF